MTEREYRKLQRDYNQMKLQYEMETRQRLYNSRISKGWSCESDLSARRRYDGTPIIYIASHSGHYYVVRDFKDWSLWNADVDVCAYPEDLKNGELSETLTILKNRYYSDYEDLKRYLDGNKVHVDDEVVWNKDDGTSCHCRVLNVDEEKGTALLCQSNRYAEYWESEAPLKDLVIYTTIERKLCW